MPFCSAGGGGGRGGDQICHFSVLTNCWKKGKNRQNKLKKKTHNKTTRSPRSQVLGHFGSRLHAALLLLLPFPSPRPKTGQNTAFLPISPPSPLSTGRASAPGLDPAPSSSPAPAAALTPRPGPGLGQNAQFWGFFFFILFFFVPLPV